MGEIYQVGIAGDPSSADGCYRDLQEAIESASVIVSRTEQERNRWADPVAVWDRSGDIVYLLAYGQQFRSV